MKAHLWLAIFALRLQDAACQNCSNITLQPVGSEAPDSQTWAYGVSKIQFDLAYTCSNDFNIAIRWKETDGRHPFPNGNISLSSGQTSNGTSELTIEDQSGDFNTTITLNSTAFQDSVLYLSTIYVNKSFNIFMGYCPPVTMDQTRNYSYNAEKKEECDIPTNCNGKLIPGTRKRTCGKFTTWEVSECKRDEYPFTFDSEELKVPLGTIVSFNCSKQKMELFDGMQNKTMKKENITIANHNKTIFCFNEDDVGNRTNVRIDVSSALVLVTTPPISSEPITGEAVINEMYDLKIPFTANPTLVRSNITVTHEGKKVTDYFMLTKGISQTILLHFPKVTAKNFGEYNVTLIGFDELCVPQTLNIIATLTKDSTLPMGWIVTIITGSVLLIVVIVFIVVVCRQKKRYKEDISLSAIPRKEPIQHASPPMTQQGTQLNASFRNPSDDEFESDDDKPASPMRDRPPMPLPPSPRTTLGRPHANTGHNSRPPVSQQNRELPPAPGAGSYQGQRNLIPPMRDVPPPPAHSRQMPGYPHHGQNFNGGCR